MARAQRRADVRDLVFSAQEGAAADFEQRIDSMYLVNGKLILLTQDYGYPGAWDIALPAIWPP